MSLKGTVWAPIGPSPISESTTQDNGMVTAIAPNPSNPNILYIGTAGGGAWHTIDGGAHWTPIFDRQLSLGIGEPAGLAVDPNNTNVIYIGTSGRVTRQPQAGLFKSTDGGASWILLGSGYPAGNTGNASQFAAQDINVIIVDPADSNVLYLGSVNGVFWSTDAGQNWTAGNNAFSDARSLVLDTSSSAGSRILYAGLSGRGAFRSNDGGRNWTQILSGSTPAVSSAIGPAPNGFNKTVIAIAPPASPPNAAGVQVLYVSLQGTGGANDPVGLFLSKDQGATWAQQTASSMPKNSQGGYSFHMAVDPSSPGDGVNDIIYFGCVGQAKSTDSGVSFNSIPVLHADTHAWAFTPQPGPNPPIVFCGNDGGIDRSLDGGVTWAPINGGGLQTALFYNIDLRPDAGATVTVGALQDNEVETTKGGSPLGWNATQGGDGWDVAYDGLIASQVYCTSGFWSPAPCTRVHRSTDDGSSFPTEITPWSTATDTGCYLAPITTDPSTGGIVYVSGSQNLWQSQDGGGTWRILSPFASTGNVDVAPTNGNNVVIAVGNKVFVSTNALAATVGPPSGVTFTDVTRNLPSRNVARAKFDPNDPTVIYCVLGGFDGGGAQNGHVFRTTVTASSWTDISPALDLPCSAIALDGEETPTVLYIGTDLGVIRSVDAGSTWTVLDDIHFPRAPVLDLGLRSGVLRAATYGRGVFGFIKPTGPAIAVNMQDGFFFGVGCKTPRFLTLHVYNVGASDLVIESVQRLMGSPNFSVLSTPGTPLVLGPGDGIDFTVAYTPLTAGTLDVATIRIVSNDPAAPFVDLTAVGGEGVPNIATAIANGGNIGNVCLGSFVEEVLTINNGGACPLRIWNITSSSAEFLTPSVAAYPLRVASGDSIDVVIRFEPSSFGAKFATIQIASNDPAGTHTISVSGVALNPKLATLIADSGNFGKCCLGSFTDEPLILNNTGRCTLSISAITSSSPEFLVPSVVSYPAKIEAGGSLAIPIRFQPLSLGPQSGTITIDSDDPAGPHTVSVSGTVPSGTLAVTGSTIFGGVEYGCCPQQSVVICNVGECDLHVSSVALKHRHRHFRLINNPFPATLRPGSCLEVVLQYRATEKYPKACELVILSDDPVTPVKCLDVLAYTLWQHFCCDCCDACRSRCCAECRRGCCDRCSNCRGAHRDHHRKREHGEEQDDDE